MPKANKKKKDFDKPKLKVGKKKPQQTNATETSFKSKAILVPNQLRTEGVDHYLSLLRHHQAAVRCQALTQLDQYVDAEPRRILVAVAPLITDTDRNVRAGCRSLLRQLDPHHVAASTAIILLYVHAAMTHINTGVRSESTLVLDWLLDVATDDIKRIGFEKSLQLFPSLLGFADKGSGGVVVVALAFSPKTRTAHLQALRKLIAIGASPDVVGPNVLFHPDTVRFLLPTVSDPYTPDATEDCAARLEIVNRLRPVLSAGLLGVTREGGELGRLASKIQHELRETQLD